MKNDNIEAELDPATVTVADVIRSPIIFLQSARDHGSSRITFQNKAEAVRFYNRVRALIHVRGDELMVAARRDGLSVIAGQAAIPEAELEIGLKLGAELLFGHRNTRD